MNFCANEKNNFQFTILEVGSGDQLVRISRRDSSFDGQMLFSPIDFFAGIYVKLNVFDSVFSIKVTNCNFCSDICSYGI